MIQVAAGTYRRERGRRQASSALVQTELTLLGGFSPDFASRDASQFRSVIDGKGTRRRPCSSTSSRAARPSSTGSGSPAGAASAPTSEDGNGRGGGVFVEILGNGEVLISHNEIYGNQTSELRGREPRRRHPHRRRRTTTARSRSIRIEDNVIHSNQAGRGAGINVTGRQRRDPAQRRRGEPRPLRPRRRHLRLDRAAPRSADNVVRGNEIGATVKYGWGGGIIIAAAPAELHGNVVTGNYAPTNGSGVFWDEGAKGTMREDLLFANGCPSDERLRRGALRRWRRRAVGRDARPRDHRRPQLPVRAPAGAAILVEDGSKLTVKDSIIWGNTREFAGARQGHLHGRELDHDGVRQGQQHGRPAVRRSRNGRLPPQARQRHERGFQQDQPGRLPEVSITLPDAQGVE